MRKEKGKKESKLLVLFGTILGVLFFTFNLDFANAEIISVEQPISSYSTTTISGTIPQQKLGHLTSGYLIDSIQMAVRETSGEGGSVFLNVCFNGNWSSQFVCSGNQDSLQANFSDTVTSNIEFQTLSFLSSTTTNSSHDYALQIATGGGEKPEYIAGSVNSNSYLNGFYALFIGGSYQTLDLQDSYFRLGAGLSSSYSGGDYVSISFPHNNEILNLSGNSSTTSTFSEWYLNYSFSTTTNLGGSSNGNGTLCVYFGLFCPSTEGDETILLLGVRYGTSSVLQSNGLIPGNFVDVKEFGQLGTASTTLPRTNGLIIGDWYAQAFIQARPPSVNGVFPAHYYPATSTVIRFSVTGADNTPSPFIQAPNPDNLTGSSCDNSAMSSGFWTDLRNCFMEILFDPSTKSLQSIKNSMDGISQFFPFNIFFDFNNTSMSYLIGQASSTGQSLNLDFDFPGGTTAQFEVLKPNILESTIGTTTKNKLFEIQRNLIWTATGIAMIFMVL